MAVGAFCPAVTELGSYDNVNTSADIRIIPILHGHHGVVRRRFIAAWIACLACVVVGVFAPGHFGVWLHLSLGAAFLVSFAVGVRAFFMAKQATCPQCGNGMTQTWDSTRHRSTGIFRCSSCSSQWRTDFVYGYGGN